MTRFAPIALLALFLAACTGTDTQCNENGICMTGYATLAGSKIVTGRVYFDADNPKVYQTGPGETSETLPVQILKSAIPAAALIGAAKAVDLSADLNVGTGR